MNEQPGDCGNARAVILIAMGPDLDRIGIDPTIMGGRPCVKGTRVTVGVVVGLLAEGHSKERVLELYPYLSAADLYQCLSYAAWRSEEQELSLIAQ
jgi:uncharacterized protein (DUF433 family)